MEQRESTMPELTLTCQIVQKIIFNILSLGNKLAHMLKFTYCVQVSSGLGGIAVFFNATVKQELDSYLYTPGSVCGTMKLFSRSRSTSFSIRRRDGSRSLGSFAGRIVSDWKKVALSLREEADNSRAGDTRLLSRCTKR